MTLQNLGNHITNNGPESVLPHNLTDPLLFYLMDEANIFLEQKSKEDEETVFAGLVLCVITILQAQQESNKVTVGTEEFVDNLTNYALALSLEKINRKTEITVTTPATIDNILENNRKIEFQMQNPEDIIYN